jgi:ABC-type multidrug transport system ATPase subunit
MTANAGRAMREYSKGMLQRITLAQAMLHDPRLMVLDEPVTGWTPWACAKCGRSFTG